MQKGGKLLIVSLLLFIFAACSRENERVFEAGKGGLKISLETILPSASTRADILPGDLHPEDFKVEILNSKGIIFKRWNTYAEYQAQENRLIQMNAGGPYYIRATYGDSTLSGFRAFFFMGETEFFVVPQETVDVSVKCRMANVKVAVVYGENIQKDYKDYTVTAENSKGSLEFGKDCVEAGYMPVEDIQVRMKLTDPDGKDWYFRNRKPVQVHPGDFVTLRIDTKKIPEQQVGITITVDTSTEDHQVNVDLPAFMLPADPPVLTPQGFDAESGRLTLVEGTTPATAKLNIQAESKVKTCKLKVNSTYLTGSLGWPTEIDFTALTPDVRNILSQYGVIYTDNMKGQYLANVDLTGLAKVFRFADAEDDNVHAFELTVSDELDKTTVKSVSFVPTLADKALQEIPAGDVWAKKVYADLTTANGNPALLVPEMKTQGGQWQKAGFTSVSVQGTTRRVLITGLQPQTDYSFRAVYNDHAEGAFRTVRTEADAQVANADMEAWSEKDVLSYSIIGKEYQKTYFPWSDAAQKWWDTNNAETTQTSGTPAALTFKCFPMVTWTTGRNGGKAAQIMAIAINDFNTSGTSLSNATPGQLFIGTHKGEQGHAFASRPSKFRFHFNYTPRQTDTFRATVEVRNGQTVIGRGVHEQTASAPLSGWNLCDVNITYSDTALKATSIYIHFIQSTGSGKGIPYQINAAIQYPAGNAHVHGGSILTVDDIELIYE